MRFWEAVYDVGVPALGIGVFLVDECDSSKCGLQCCHEVLSSEIAFEALTLFSVGIEEYDRRSPYGFEAVEPRGMFFDVGSNGDEVLRDEVSDVWILVRLGFQPSAGSSGRRSTEIEKDRTILLLGFV
jgi:hypothetical protein